MALAIGDPAPAFQLPATDGKQYSLDDFKDKPALVVIFSCNHCPYVQAYEGRIKAIQEELGPKGAQIVAINANETVNYPEDSFDKMKSRARAQGFNFPYLRDEAQAVASAYGGERTPHVFLFDRDRKLAYTGAIDDNWQDASAATRPYLREAIGAVLTGKAVAEPSTHAVGCSIKWNK
jgi:peroxiredoxin